ncbi:MAG TPA: thioredoxin [Candidatus Saccharicenans sp.]|jgi:thioredoxin 1|nr:thioredoxin [Candidatus Saccharicenans sp.]HRD02859.1 thioredoxin [Candidatus Saccharicenans sp.]
MSTKVVQLNESNFGQEVLKSNLPVLVDFWAPWCGPCQTVNLVIEELAESYQGRLKVAKLNVDENSNLSSLYQIVSIPTMILFKNGQPVDSLTGVSPKQKLEKFLRQHL